MWAQRWQSTEGHESPSSQHPVGRYVGEEGRTVPGEVGDRRCRHS